MITGIDETGDFDPSSEKFNYFVGVHIDQNLNKYKVKNSQYNIWENSIPDGYRVNGEVKGVELSDEQLSTFYSEVLETKPTVLYSVIRIVPSENSKDVLNKHREFEEKQLENVILQAASTGDHPKWVEGYKKILAWYKNRNYQVVIKMKCLEHLLGISLNQVLAWAQITCILDDNDITNLKNITFKIDKDFVKAESIKVLWNEIFRQFWQQYTKGNPIPVVTAWKKEDHPFLKLYDHESGKADLKNVFRKQTSFLDSKESWEVRMADIIGTILHRYQNRGRCVDIGKKLIEHLGGKRKNYEHIILNTNI